MKTCNLTQISLRNDPINRQMHGFSFRVFEDEVWSSRYEFSFLFRLNFEFKSLVGTEMSQEYNETNDTWNGGLNKKNLVKIHGQFLLSRRTAFKERRIGRNRSIWWTHRDQRLRWDVIWRIGVLFCWSLDRGCRVLMRSHRIKKERLRFWSSVRFWSKDRD